MQAKALGTGPYCRSENAFPIHIEWLKPTSFEHQLQKLKSEKEAKKRRRARKKERKREEELTAKAVRKLASQTSDPRPPHPSTIPRPTAPAPSAHDMTRTAVQPANNMPSSTSRRNTIIIPPRPLPSPSSSAPRGVRRAVGDQPVSRRVRPRPAESPTASTSTSQTPSAHSPSTTRPRRNNIDYNKIYVSSPALPPYLLD
ncbi:hypothetical protein BDZ89DRAFT_1047127 [Hymenopellis radicata]|nr:hypothetical protein BDZ89DRAFT_1047127 [Hymenopellis radicata]